MHHPLELHVTHETGTPVVRFTIAGASSVLGVADIEAMIAQLVGIRGAMQPAHPVAPPVGAYPMEVDPCWRLDRANQFDGVILSLRHPGIGWTAFALPSSSLASLREAMSSLSMASVPMRQAMLN